MDDARWFNLAAGLLAVLVTAAGLTAIAFTPSTSSAAPAPSAGPSAPTTYRTLVIAPDTAAGGVSYSARTLTVPLHERVVFTITNFDPTVATLPTPRDAQVMGTFGGPMTIHEAQGSVVVGQLPAAGVSHTFTMSNAYYAINVPIPPAQDPATPSQVTFTVVFDTPGTYTWGCVVLCLGDGMGAANAMDGSLTVG